MPRYAYKAMGMDGSRVVGELEAATPADAARALKAKKLHPVSVRQQKTGQRRAPKRSHVLQFIEDLAGLIDSNIGLDKALHLAAGQSEDDRLAQAGREMAHSVHKGKSLAQAMEPYADFFGPAAAPLVRAGEASGQVAETLQNLATGWRSELAFRKAFLASLVYPSMLCAMSILTLGVLVFYVMPNFALVFDAVDATPPQGVRLLLGFGEMVRRWWWLPLMFLLLVLLAVRFSAFGDHARSSWDRLVLRLPLVDRIIIARGLARYFATLGRLLEGGVPLVGALSLAQRATGNEALQKRLAPAVSEVKIGRPLSSYFAKDAFFPKRVGSLLRIAEEQGTLSRGCLSLGARFEEETKVTLARLTTWIEPVVILATGIIIGVAVIGMFTTIISVTNVDF